MIVTNDSSKTSTKPCGCGGGCECNCNTAACQSTCDTGLTRPNFFAGQLLTDEDLQSMLDYVVEKNRLHNRHFLGDGVVCGLEVRHHPCPESQCKVIVKPGHALDCCGNDIVVPCEEELDVVRMAQELKTKASGGYDCVDPCREKMSLFTIDFGPAADLDRRRISSELQREFARYQQPLPPEASVVVLEAGREWRVGGVILYRIRKDANGLRVYREGDEAKANYFLYIRYEEQRIDPVQPFDVDDRCNRSGCHPSRIRESYQFELCCDDQEPDVDLRTRMSQCSPFPDQPAVAFYQELQAQTLHGARSLETAEQVLVQFQAIAALLTDEASGAANRTLLYDTIRGLTVTDPGPTPSIEDQVNEAKKLHQFVTLSLRRRYRNIRTFG